jgi:hypothetical protein
VSIAPGNHSTNQGCVLRRQCEPARLGACTHAFTFLGCRTPDSTSDPTDMTDPKGCFKDVLVFFCSVLRYGLFSY